LSAATFAQVTMLPANQSDLDAMVSKADQGDPDTQLAHAYMGGEGVPVDKDRGMQLISQGIAAGSVTCMSMMAQTDMHFGNFAEARAFFVKADAGGDEAAASALAAIYEHGLGVKMDLNIAIYWYNKASQQGDATAAAKAAALMDIVEGRNKAPPPDR
jgi:uncharacterized protein